jgi:hypothetical protein
MTKASKASYVMRMANQGDKQKSGTDSSMIVDTEGSSSLSILVRASAIIKSINMIMLVVYMSTTRVKRIRVLVIFNDA